MPQRTNKEELTWDLRGAKLQTSNYFDLAEGQNNDIAIEENDLTAQELNDKINVARAFGEKRLLMPKFFGSQRWTREEPYSPPVINGIGLKIPFNVLTNESKQLGFYNINTRYYVRNNGRYWIQAKYTVIPTNTAIIQWLTSELNLYKNGIFYSNLQYDRLVVTYPTVGNFHFPQTDLQGEDLIDLTIDDYIEIEFRYTRVPAGVDLGVGDLHAGRLFISHYENNIKVQ